jgi:hypothetical protein
VQVREALAERLSAAAAAARADADAWGGGHAAPGPPLPGELPGLAAELQALTAGVASVQALQVDKRVHIAHHTRWQVLRTCSVPAVVSASRAMYWRVLLWRVKAVASIGRSLVRSSAALYTGLVDVTGAPGAEPSR